MEIKFIPADLKGITGVLAEHLSTLSSPVDTFFEGHVEKSSHYYIHINGINAGHMSIHDGRMITQFCLHDAFKRYGQVAFQRVKKMESVQRAFVPTCDEFFLSHALDEHRHFEKQAYFFQQSGSENPIANETSLFFCQAESSDVDLIRQVSDDFFDPIVDRIKSGEIFITYKDDECAGIGVMILNKFCLAYADIGLFTVESFRNMGIGTATLRYLMKECKQKQRQPVAGCWYYNHFSKRTLEKAGMYSQTRLLKISY